MIEQLGLVSIKNDKRKVDSMISSNMTKKTVDKSIVEKQLPKFFNASSVVNSINKIDLKHQCQYEPLIELESHP